MIMFDAIFYSFFSVVIVSLLSLLGVSAFFLKNLQKEEVMHFLVSFAAGALLGDVFFHILPEITEELGFTFIISVSALAGIITFFILEKFLSWHHCHVHHHKKGVKKCDHEHLHDKKSPAPFVYMNLFADGLHNFIDGMVIAASYLVSIPLGIATTIAVIFHEIPQEIGDFAILLHGGFTVRRALFLNFLSAITAIIGALFAFFVSSFVEGIMIPIIAFAAGNFIYIAGVDLVPELHKKFSTKSAILQLLIFILGAFIMYTLLFME